tara:strand:- start:1739 stop:1945 length:207 start_codon:yes stop_codon:yes gene_type:complete
MIDDTLNDNYLNQTYKEFNKEYLKLMNQFELKEKEDIGLQRQIKILQSISMEILKFRNLRKKLKENEE